MKQMIIEKIDAQGVAAIDVKEVLDRAAVEFQGVDCVNWPEEFAYKPDVKVRVAHCSDALLINYRVTEQSVRAIYGQDNGSVWTDSCAEFFVQPKGEGPYYNIESNCIGTVLVGLGEGRHNRTHASAQLIAKIGRWSSLGLQPFDVLEGECNWQMSLVVPVEVFAESGLESFDGAHMRGNFYKCGDELPVAHFVSWSAIHTPSPDFHRPDFFAELICR